MCLPGFDVELEVEAVDQQVLVHGVEVIDGVLLVGLRFDILAIFFDPGWAVDDLARRDPVHEGDHHLYRKVGCGIAIGACLDGLGAMPGRAGRTDGRNIEGEPGRMGRGRRRLGVRQRGEDGYAAER